jgi:hypothetical protein
LILKVRLSFFQNQMEDGIAFEGSFERAPAAT